MDNGSDEAAFRNELMQIAMTTLSSKLVYHEKEYFAGLAVDAVLRLKGSGNLDHIHVLKKPGGSMRDSYLADGFIIDKRARRRPAAPHRERQDLARQHVDGARAPHADKIKVYVARRSRVRVDSLSKVAEIEEAERDKMRNKCQKIIDHGVNVFINRQLIYNFPEEIMTQGGLMTIEHADFEGIERLAMVTGGEIASTFDHPELTVLGECKLIEEIMIGEDRLLAFLGLQVQRRVHARAARRVGARARGGRAVDARRALACSRAPSPIRAPSAAAGAPRCSWRRRSTRRCPTRPARRRSRWRRSVRARCASCRASSRTTAAMTRRSSVTQLRAAHAAGQSTAGLDMYKRHHRRHEGARRGGESFKSKLQVLISASEAAEMILRVDDIIKCAPRQREGH